MGSIDLRFFEKEGIYVKVQDQRQGPVIRFFDPWQMVENCDILDVQLTQQGDFVRLEARGEAPAGAPVFFSQNYYLQDPLEAQELKTHKGLLAVRNVEIVHRQS